ncbi:MAG: N-6 DNA methylase [Sedimentisphaerales bacterium]|jgi:type I restriction enzyme M protein
MDKSFQEILKQGISKGYFRVFNNSSEIEYIAQNHKDKLSDPEEQVRVGLFYDLIEKHGYKNTKAIIDLEILRKIGHPHKKTDSKADIIVYSQENKPFILFELKSWEEYDRYFEDSIKTQLFERAATEDKSSGNLKFLIYYTRTYEDGEEKEKLVTIDYSTFKTFEDWEDKGRQNLRYIPKNYGIKDRPPAYIRGIKGQDLREDVRKEELDRIARELHNILWGGGKYQNELFFNLIGLFLAKILDEKKTQDGKPYQFQIFFEGGDQEKSATVYERMNKLYKIALKELLKITPSEVAKKPDIIFDANKVKYVVEVLQEISFLKNKYDVLGDFFEKIVRSELKQTKGQYLTHHNIVDFILYAIKLDEFSIYLVEQENRLPYIVDPACGSSTFLIHAMKLITSTIEESRNKFRKNYATEEFLDKSFQRLRKNAWAEEFVYGIEINADLAMASKVNMVGHGDGSAHIESQDGLAHFNNYHDRLSIHDKKKNYDHPVNEQFDIVVSNPPFSVQVDKDTAKQFPFLYYQGQKIYDSIKKKKKGEEQTVDTENLFIERWYQLLKPGGRMGVVLPESFFDTTSDRSIRLFVYKYFWIKAVVSLPHLTFAPYTMTKTSLLFAQKKTDDEVTQWNILWDKYSQQYKYSRSFIDKIVKAKKKSSFDKTRFIKELENFLGEKIDAQDTMLSIEKIIEKYQEDIKEVDLDWWTFRKVSSQQDYPIFMAHAEEIGYKRGARREELRPNFLFDSESNDLITRKIIINDANPRKILDHLRKLVVWSNY